MKTPLAACNLAHNKLRTAVATGGVAFAVALMFIQLGFFQAVRRVAVLVYDGLDFDVAVTSRSYVSLTQAGDFPRPRLYQAMGVEGVASAVPFYTERVQWTNPRTRARRSVIVLAAVPDDRVFLDPEIGRQQRLLTKPDAVLVDRLSRPELGSTARGTVAELSGQDVQVVGRFTWGPGFESGMVVTGADAFGRLSHRSLDKVSVGLIRLDDGADPRRVAERLRRSLPPDVAVLTRDELAFREQRYWVVSTATGLIFGSGLVMACAFAVVVIHQVLSSDIAHRLPEYATLKAIGYSEWQVSAVVLRQAVILAVLGFVPATLMTLAVYELVGRATHLPVAMTAARAAGVFGLTLTFCLLSALLSVHKVRRADPADLF